MKCDKYGIFLEPCCSASHLHPDCSNELEHCTYFTLPGPRRYVAQKFVGDMKKILAREKIIQGTEVHILREFGGFFGNEKAWQKYTQEGDNIEILAPMDDMLHDLVKEHGVDYGSYAQIVMSMDRLMNEWNPVFARFEGNPKP